MLNVIFYLINYNVKKLVAQHDGKSLVLLEDTVIPLAEKRRSLQTDVAGTSKKWSATGSKRRNAFLSSVGPIVLSFK